ncbi:MAG: hypothetical protein ACRC6M_04960, partial [Microcystaceae cyanobacterium]
MKLFPDWHPWLEAAELKARNFERKYCSHPPNDEKKVVSPSLHTSIPLSCLAQRVHDSRKLRRLHHPLMFGLTVISLTSVVGYRFYNQPQLAVDRIAPITVIAPRTAEFTDEKTTAEKRKEVRAGTVPRLKRDVTVTQNLKQSRGELLDQINDLRKLGAPFPFIDPQIISLLEQQQLRSSSETDWPQLRDRLTFPPSLTDAQRQTLIVRITEARSRYQAVLGKLSQGNSAELSPQTIVAALQLNNQTWKTTQQTIIRVFDRILMQGIPSGINPQVLRETIQLNLKSSLPPQAEPVATEILFFLLEDQSNLTIDTEETKHQSEQAALSVEPIKVSIEKGEVIVKQGETINQSQFVLLDNLGLSQRGINFEGLALTAILVSGSVLIFWGISLRIHRPLRRRDHLLLCLLSISSPLMTFLHPRYGDLPAIGLLVGSFYGPTLAVSQVILVGSLSGFALENISWEYQIAGMVAGMVAALIAGRLRSRDDVALLGAGIGVIQAGVYWLSYLVVSSSATVIWYTVLPGAVICGLLGMAWIIVAIGISPYLERFFDVVTPIRLVEL